LTLGGTIFLHTRALAVLGIYLASMLLARFWLRMPGRWQWTAGLFLVCGLLILIVNDASTWRPYGWPVTILTLLFLIPALRESPRESHTLLLFIIGLLLASQVNIPYIKRALTGVVDRPFVQMSLFIPLAVLTASGIKAISKYLVRWPWLNKKSVKVGGGLLLGALLLAGFQAAGLTRPSVCCQFVYPEDVYALAWIENEIPEDQKIVIAGFAPPYKEIGNDGGIWIQPLTGRETTLMRYDANWKAKKWHQVVFTLVPVGIYEILGCAGEDAPSGD